jgi:hypothetical protein
MTRKKRYVMSYSEAMCMDMVVYANTLDEANELFENGEFIYEEEM